MPYYLEGEVKRPRWRFWRNKGGQLPSQPGSADKQSGSRSRGSSRDGPPLEGAGLPGQPATASGSDASSERRTPGGAGSASAAASPRTPSGSSTMAPLEYTRSTTTTTTTTTTASPVVTREAHTDPATGELVITVTSTTVTTTTTRRAIRVPPPTPTPTATEVDLDEERRLAAEYLASSGLDCPPPRPPGLHPAPRRSGSHSNLVSRAAEQARQPAATGRSYSMGSRTGPRPSFSSSSSARNFSRPATKQAGEEAQGRSSLDAGRGPKKAEAPAPAPAARPKPEPLILRKPDPKKPADAPDREHHQQDQSYSVDITALRGANNSRPHTGDGGEKRPLGQRRLNFHRPKALAPQSQPVEQPELSPWRVSWGTFGGRGAGKQQQHNNTQQATSKFMLGIPSAGKQLGNMF